MGKKFEQDEWNVFILKVGFESLQMAKETKKRIFIKLDIRKVVTHFSFLEASKSGG